MLIHGSLRWLESSPTGALRPRSLLLLAGVGRSQASSNEPSTPTPTVIQTMHAMGGVGSTRAMPRLKESTGD